MVDLCGDVLGPRPGTPSPQPQYQTWNFVDVCVFFWDEGPKLLQDSQRLPASRRSGITAPGGITSIKASLAGAGHLMSSNGASTTPVPSTPPCCPRRAQASAVLGHETPRSGDIPRPTSLTAPYIFRKKFRVATSTSWPRSAPRGAALSASALVPAVRVPVLVLVPVRNCRSS